MVNIAVCDDSKEMRCNLHQRVQEFLKENGIEAAVHQFASGEDLLSYEGRIDVLFLDIQMLGTDGMRTAKKLRQAGFNGFLIFVTVLPELVYDAFAVQAFDYLVKPLNEDRFSKVMLRLLDSMKSAQDDVLLIRSKHESRLIPFDDIVYCEVIDRKVYLHLTSGETIDYYEKIENLEKRLCRSFYRCHRSYLINLKHMKSYGNGTVVLQDETKIPVSRLRAKDFSNVILQYMRG